MWLHSHYSARFVKNTKRQVFSVKYLLLFGAIALVKGFLLLSLSRRSLSSARSKQECVFLVSCFLF